MDDREFGKRSPCEIPDHERLKIFVTDVSLPLSDQLDGDSEMRLATNASFTIVFPSIVDNQKTVDEII